MSSRVAIVGFGFGGMMTLAQLVRHAKAPMHVTIIAPDTRGVGLAYSTHNPMHLLNVPARNMSAFPHEHHHFVRWLESPEADLWRQEMKLEKLPGEADFAPRILYGHYLNHILEATILTAAKHGITVAWRHGYAHSITRDGAAWKLTTDEGDVTAERVVIATGNEAKNTFPGIDHPGIVEQPWTLTAEQVATWGNHPIIMVGTGLTSVDIILTLRRMGYHGAVHAISRNGLLPLPHKPNIAPYTLNAEILDQPNLLALLRVVRRAIHDHARASGDWRAVIDALRPHAIALWQNLNTRDQLSFIRRLATMWNSHRHRMAPEIFAIMQQEITSGKLHLAASHHFHVTLSELSPRRVTGSAFDTEKMGPVMRRGDRIGEVQFSVQYLDGRSEILKPAAILNCTGPELNWARSSQPLLQQLLRDGHVKAHPTNLGIVADTTYKAGDNLWAIGNPMNGQFWESTAVPELRVQAETLGAQLCQ